MLPAADGGQLPETRVPISIDSDWLRSAVADLFARNRVTRRERSGRESTYHAPSLGPFPGRYTHQWFWDSCAHAIALCHIDVSLARQEVLSLLAAQNESGFIPHLVFNPARMHLLDHLVVRLHPLLTHSPYLQPPALAQAVQAAHTRQPSREFLASVLPGLKAYYRYLSRTRDRAGDDLLEIVHSFESGKDRSREYDEVYGRRLGLGIRAAPMWVLVARQRAVGWDMERIFRSDVFRVKDLLFNCIYATNLSVLAQLCRDNGEDAESEYFAAQAVRTEAAILGRMYDPEDGLFYSLDARRDADRQIKVSTVSTFLPLLLDSITREQVERLVEQHLANDAEYWLDYPVPSEPLDSPEAGWRLTGLWRGLQTWVFPNWFIFQGLLKQARRFQERRPRYRDLARQLAERTYEMVHMSGFREYYHSVTGRGDRALNFGMSALVLDMVIGLEQGG